MRGTTYGQRRAVSTPAPLTFSPAPRRSRGSSVVARIYHELRTSIVDLRLPPGTVLSKNQLAGEFGVSPTPVREALLRLSAEGLVDIVPQARTSVSLLDVQHAREAFVLRLSVDVEVARMLAPAVTEPQIEALRELLQRQRAELEAGDLSAFTREDHAFHARIYEYAGVAGLWELVRSRQAHLERLRRLHLPEPGKGELILDHHRAIVAGIASRDRAAAEAAARAHLGAALAASDELRARFPDYFA